MDTLTDTITTANESALKALTDAQEQILSVQRDVSAAFAKAFDLPSSTPSPSPLSDVSVDSLVAMAYEFRAQKLEADKRFALGLVDIWSAPAIKPAKSPRTSK